ncbi:MAG: cypE [Planctomycetaceae bacterium]|nr:cypE [Planctomycetaceae bacterium]
MLFERIFSRTFAPFASLPGPRPLFPIGNLLNFFGKFDRPWEVMARYGELYGGMCAMWLFNQPAIVLNDARLIGEVLCSRTQDFYKDEPCGALIPVLTRSSPNINNGEEWTRTRRQSPMTQPWIVEWRERQMPALRNVLRKWAERMASVTETEALPFQKEVQRVTFDCFSVATVGSELTESCYSDFLLMASLGSKRMLTPMRPSAELNTQGQETRKRFLRGLRERYDNACSKSDPAATDLLSMALRNHTQLPADELSAEMGNVFYGGCFSVPSTLVSTLYLLSQNPEEFRKLKAAIRQLGDDCDLMTLLECRPLDYALREGMRLLPAVPLFGRRVLTTAATELGGCQLPPNTNIWICNWLLQRSAPQWDRPLNFLPDRWSGGVAEANPLGSDYFFPEGRGPRICLGAEYSIFYMKLVLATLLSRWDIECGQGQAYDAGQGFFFGVRMPYGLRAKLCRRTDD